MEKITRNDQDFYLVHTDSQYNYYLANQYFYKDIDDLGKYYLFNNIYYLDPTDEVKKKIRNSIIKYYINDTSKEIAWVPELIYPRDKYKKMVDMYGNVYYYYDTFKIRAAGCVSLDQLIGDNQCIFAFNSGTRIFTSDFYLSPQELYARQNGVTVEFSSPYMGDLKIYIPIFFGFLIKL